VKLRQSVMKIKRLKKSRKSCSRSVKCLAKLHYEELNGYVAELINVQMEKEEFLDSEE